MGVRSQQRLHSHPLRASSHRHRVDVERQEPRQARNAKLDVRLDEVLVNHRQRALHQMLKDATVEDGTGHGLCKVARQQAVAEGVEEEVRLLLGAVDEKGGGEDVEALCVA